MYWTDITSDKIQRANLDGTDVEDLITFVLPDSQTEPFGISLDAINGKMYWADGALGTISCANLDGTNQEILVSGLAGPRALVVAVPEPTALCFLYIGCFWLLRRKQ